MNTVAKNHERTQKLVGTAVLTAIVVILQFVSLNLRFTLFSITLVLMPVVLGAALYGMATGAWLGFVFGIVVLATGDAAAFLAISIPATVAVVLVKGTLAGFVSGVAYRALERFNRYAAVIVASILSPVTNTGVFLIGCRLFFWETIKSWASAGGQSVVNYVIFGLCGINFIIELAINLVLDPAIVRLLDILKKPDKAETH